nr:MAG TPA: hypothetical protein [Caudoviricetes sp.]
MNPRRTPQQGRTAKRPRPIAPPGLSRNTKRGLPP